MCTLNPQPSQLVDPVKWDRRVPLGKMAVISFQGVPKVFGPGSAITEEMFSSEFFWDFDPEKWGVIEHGMIIPEDRTLVAFVQGGFEFTYGGQRASLVSLKVGTIVDQTDEAVDAAIKRYKERRVN